MDNQEISVKSSTPPATVAVVCLAVMAMGIKAWSADWPQWGGTPGKNMAANEKAPPDSFEPGQKETQSHAANLSRSTLLNPTLFSSRHVDPTGQQLLEEQHAL
jgi:hypothetical protein